jgi:hypothetical protein
MAGLGHRQELLDLAGDGHLDLAELGGPMPGVYERTSDRGWRPFRTFGSQPDIAWDDPGLRLPPLRQGRTRDLGDLRLPLPGDRIRQMFLVLGYQAAVRVSVEPG